jgi:hypothetical protein
MVCFKLASSYTTASLSDVLQRALLARVEQFRIVFPNEAVAHCTIALSYQVGAVRAGTLTAALVSAGLSSLQANNLLNVINAAATEANLELVGFD